MEELITGYGYGGLFLMSFLASTVVPVGSEWLLAVLLLRGFDPAGLLVSASVGNYLGALTTYGVGIFGSDFIIEKVLRVDRKKRARAEQIYSRFGTLSLFFSWLPVVGDPFCLIAGIMKAGLIKFSIYVFTGKLLRYSAVIYLTLKSAEYLAK